MSESGQSKAKVLIVGGGVAGLEAALALRALCRDRVTLDLLAPGATFAYRPLAVAEPFELTPAFEVDLAEFATDNYVTLWLGGLERVEAEERSALSSSGERLPYDYLVMATGAVLDEPLPGAFSFIGRDGVRAFSRLLFRLERGEVQGVIFAGGASPSYVLPLYELAMMTSTFAKARDLDVELSVVTEESVPLEAFGGGVRADISRLLAGADIDVHAGRNPLRFEDGRLHFATGDAIDADEVVAIPGLRGPGHAGLPADDDGFIPVDDRCRIAGREREFAAGDVTAFPVKHGGIAAQQADVVASAIAQDLGEPSDGRPFRPSLEGTFLTGEGAHLLSAPLTGSGATSSRHQVRGDWRPLAKVSARYLGAYLSAREGRRAGSAGLDSERLAADLEDDWERPGISPPEG